MAEEIKVKDLQKAEKAIVKAEKIIEKDIEIEEKNSPRWLSKNAQAKDVAEKKKIAAEAQAFVHKQNLLKLSEISLILDTYDDLFSDFDPRPFDHRAISDDFLREIKRASKENTIGIIELQFMMPEKLRKPDQELLIKKRLREHFRKHFESVRAEVRGTRRTGFLMVLSGVILSLATAIFVAPLESTGILANVAVVLLEPASWFTIWEGALKMFDGWKVLQPDLDFYSKMSKCEVVFASY